MLIVYPSGTNRGSKEPAVCKKMSSKTEFKNEMGFIKQRLIPTADAQFHVLENIVLNSILQLEFQSSQGFSELRTLRLHCIDRPHVHLQRLMVIANCFV